jgi:hypothetical protein
MNTYLIVDSRPVVMAQEALMVYIGTNELRWGEEWQYSLRSGFE